MDFQKTPPIIKELLPSYGEVMKCIRKAGAVRTGLGRPYGPNGRKQTAVMLRSLLNLLDIMKKWGSALGLHT